MDNEELNVYIVPENVSGTGRIFNGMFRGRNFAEAVAIGGPLAYLCYCIPFPENLMNVKIGLLTFLAGGAFMIAVTGINGDSLTEFLFHYISFRKSKRISKYNPRVKDESTPDYLTKGSYMLPKDRLMRLLGFTSLKDEYNDNPISREIYDPIYKEFFRDDVDVVELPNDLKSKKQRKSEEKNKGFSLIKGGKK